jgi:DNA-binding XRE family transcriptional regulator
VAEDPEKTIRAMGRRVAELRDERGWTQEEFAERVGCSTKYIQGGSRRGV